MEIYGEDKGGGGRPVPPGKGPAREASLPGVRARTREYDPEHRQYHSPIRASDFDGGRFRFGAALGTGMAERVARDIRITLRLDEKRRELDGRGKMQKNSPPRQPERRKGE